MSITYLVLSLPSIIRHACTNDRYGSMAMVIWTPGPQPPESFQPIGNLQKTRSA
jgi:hypothetical protein